MYSVMCIICCAGGDEDSGPEYVNIDSLDEEGEEEEEEGGQVCVQFMKSISIVSLLHSYTNALIIISTSLLPLVFHRKTWLGVCRLVLCMAA